MARGRGTSAASKTQARKGRKGAVGKKPLEEEIAELASLCDKKSGSSLLTLRQIEEKTGASSYRVDKVIKQLQIKRRYPMKKRESSVVDAVVKLALVRHPITRKLLYRLEGISRETGISKNTVFRILKEKGLVRRGGIAKPPTKNEMNVIRLASIHSTETKRPVYSIGEIAKETGLRPSRISGIIKKFRVKRTGFAPKKKG